MSAATTKIVKWAAAGCVVAIIAVIVTFFCFKNKPSVKVYGQDVYPTSLKQIIKATVKSKHGSAVTRVVKFGVENFGTIGASRTQIFDTKNVTIDGKGRAVQYSVNLLDNTIGFFRPAFRIPEDIVVENIEVMESPAANGEPELTIAEGTILERSALPAPEKSDYPDCRFTCHFKGNSIVKGKPCPQELSLILEGFADRKLLGTKDLKPGDRVICITMPFNKLPQERQTTQQADDLNLFSLASYYAIDVRKINEFSDLAGTPSSGIAFTDASDKPYVSVFERHVNPPIKEEFRKAQQEAIAQELQKIEAMLAPYTPEKIAELRQKFTQAWEAEKAKDQPNYNRVVRNGKEYIWRNIENSFWALPTDYRLPDYKENPITPYNLEALIALRDFLEANGCQFLISFVPDSFEIASRIINQDFRTVPDFQAAYIAKQLLANGIETFYPSKMLIENFHRYPLAFFYPHNPHPSDTTQDVMAEIVAKRISSHYHFPETIDHALFSIKLTPHVYGEGDKQYWFPRNCDIGTNKPDTAFLCRQVLCDGKVLISDIKSPILVIGNSYMQTPMLKPDSFPTLLSSKLNIGIQRYRVSGAMGPTTVIVQKLFSSPQIMLSNKALIILAVRTSHLCSPNIFNNIRAMDIFAKSLAGKKLICTYEIKANIAANDNLAQKIYRNIISPNFFKISTNKPVVLANMDIDGIVPNKPITIVVPTCLCTGLAKYLVNGQKVMIPHTAMYGINRHLNAFCELPAGTDKLKVELVGKTGTILSIRNIQVYQ